MTVYQRKDKPGQPWYFDFELGRKRRQGYCIDPDTGEKARSKREAEDIQAAIRRAEKAKQGIEKSGIRPGAFTIAQAMALHLANQADSTEEHRTNLAMYSREILGFLKPETPVTKIDQKRVLDYRNFCADQPVRIWIGGGGIAAKSRDRRDPKNWKKGDRARSPATVNHYLDCLRGAFTQAHEAKHPVTGMPMLPFPPKVEALAVPERLPTPMADDELDARLGEAMPWVRDGAGLARCFGLRMDETARVTIHHVDPTVRGLRFKGQDQKSNRDEVVYGGKVGWQLVLRLMKQARARGQIHLITWPGPQQLWNVRSGRPIPREAWRPLKSFKHGWKKTAKRAEIEQPRRFHDVRAAYITQVARGTKSSKLVRNAARHRDQATTDRYIDAMLQETAAAVEKAMQPARRRPKLRAIAGGKR